MIKTDNEDDKMKIGSSIHKQLCGNQDYIDSNIVLNVDSENTVGLYIYDCCDKVPTITLFGE